MATPPTFTVGQVLTAAQMNAVGLWLVGSGTFSAATAVDITGISTDFQRYRLVYNTRRVDTVGMGTMTGQVYNGSTPISAGYYGGASYGNYLGQSGIYYATNNGSAFLMGNSDSAAGQSLWTYDFYLESTKGVTFTGTGFSAGTASAVQLGGVNNTTSTYTKFRFGYDYGTHTGRWTLYGYRK